METGKVFVVVGKTSDGCDTTEWAVAAYTVRSVAEDHANLANQAMDEAPGPEADLDTIEEFRSQFPYDLDPPLLEMGTSYEVWEVPLCLAVSEYVASRRKGV